MRWKALLCSAVTPLLLFADRYHSSFEPPNNQGNACEIFGEVVAPGYSDKDALQVLLIGSEAKILQSAPVVRGNFDFHLVPAGWYLFKVADRQGRILATQTQFLSETGGHVALLSVKRDHNVSGTVSLAALRHSVPRRAIQAFEEAAKAAAAGNIGKQIDRLNAAVKIDPDFAQAQCNLAAAYTQIGRLEEAVRHARIAFELDPGIIEAGPNLAALLVQLKHYAEAETVARSVLTNEKDAAWVRMLLAVSMIEQRRDLDQALVYLGQAVTEFPSARLFATHAFVDIGRLDLAVNQLKEVLRSQTEHACERASLSDGIAEAGEMRRQDLEAREIHSHE